MAVRRHLEVLDNSSRRLRLFVTPLQQRRRLVGIVVLVVLVASDGASAAADGERHPDGPSGVAYGANLHAE